MTEADHIEQLRRLIGSPSDGALLRISIAQVLLATGDVQGAINELRETLRFDADYSAAWKLLGKTLTDSGDTVAAIEAYQSGIVAAQRRGDKQSEKEMVVFLRRLQRAAQ